DLAQAVSATSATLTLASSAGLSPGLLFQVDNEQMMVTKVLSGGSLVLVQRGADGTAPASHNADADLVPVDPHGRNLAIDSVTGPPDSNGNMHLLISQALDLNGQGMFLSGQFTGALRSVTGINQWVSNITLDNTPSAEIGSGFPDVASDVVAIGVDPDTRAGHPTPSNAYFGPSNEFGNGGNDYSLGVTGVITDGGWGETETDSLTGEPFVFNSHVIDSGNVSDLAKVMGGQLILAAANTYVGQTFIEQGWVTAMNDQALGADVPGLNQDQQPGTFVFPGASLHLLAPSNLPGPNPGLTLDENLTLMRLGPTESFAAINQQGALVSLAGDNTLT